MTLIGATAIEDKLQDGVPDAIASLADAGIKLWVLTGDKQETAINIGYSCHLLTEDMRQVFIVDADDAAGVEHQIEKIQDKINSLESRRPSRAAINGGLNGSASQHQTTFMANGVNKTTTTKLEIPGSEVIDSNNHINEILAAEGGYAMVVNGHSLTHALTPALDSLFLRVATECRTVICCRVTPLQKALVVQLVKKRKNAVTLSIGDGANDVSMIKMAHIGVGISGQEGMQAVLASDFSISQFRFLKRLLLVHGRWSYLRVSRFLKYFFYKNFAFSLCHFFFAWFSGFTAQVSAGVGGVKVFYIRHFSDNFRPAAVYYSV